MGIPAAVVLYKNNTCCGATLTNGRENKTRKRERERRRRKEIELTDDVRYDERILIVQQFKFKRRTLLVSFSPLGLFLCLSLVSRVSFEISEERLPRDNGVFTSWLAVGAHARLTRFPLVPLRISRPCVHPFYLHLSHWPPFSLTDRNAYQHWLRALNSQPGVEDQHIGLRVQRTNKHFFFIDYHASPRNHTRQRDRDCFLSVSIVIGTSRTVAVFQRISLFSSFFASHVEQRS